MSLTLQDNVKSVNKMSSIQIQIKGGLGDSYLNEPITFILFAGIEYLRLPNLSWGQTTDPPLKINPRPLCALLRPIVESFHIVSIGSMPSLQG